MHSRAVPVAGRCVANSAKFCIQQCWKATRWDSKQHMARINSLECVVEPAFIKPVRKAGKPLLCEPVYTPAAG